MMTLTRSLKLAVAFGVALLATGFTANLAKASGASLAYKGTFTLPFEAHWGSLVLPAGEYSFKIDSQTPVNTILVRRDNENMGYVLIGSVTDPAATGKSELTAVPAGGVYRISTLRLQTGSNNDQLLEFAIPKVERQMPARGPEVSMVVPISMIAR
jgi:hypothetical protein